MEENQHLTYTQVHILKQQQENQSLDSQDSIQGINDSENNIYNSGDSASIYTKNKGCNEDSEYEPLLGKSTLSPKKYCKGIVKSTVTQPFEKDNSTKESVNKSNISPNIQHNLPQVQIKQEDICEAVYNMYIPNTKKIAKI